MSWTSYSADHHTTTTKTHKQPMKNFTIKFPNWGKTTTVCARFDQDAIQSARIVLELPSRALWDARIINVSEELSK